MQPIEFPIHLVFQRTTETPLSWCDDYVAAILSRHLPLEIEYASDGRFQTQVEVVEHDREAYQVTLQIKTNLPVSRIAELLQQVCKKNHVMFDPDHHPGIAW